ncbi:MAG: Holliday junction resolvase-like protein [Candidatus Micrarchaeia archaeon]
MKTQVLINELIKSKLYAECPNCQCEFKLSDAILFDGTKPFPKEAIESKLKYEQELKELEEELMQMKKSVTDKAEVAAKSVNIGKNIEKIIFTIKDFPWKPMDCRFLFDPIDLIVFEGFHLGRIKSISFIEIKSGNSRLSEHQKAIRDAIKDKKVIYREFQ